MRLSQDHFAVDRLDDETSCITLNDHQLINVLLLILYPELIKLLEHVLELIEISNELAFVRILFPLRFFEILTVKAGSEVPEFHEMREQLLATFNNMLREYVLLAIDPEMIKCFLSAVEDLWQVGRLRTELFQHLLIQHFV